MARKRMIDPDFWVDERVGQLSRDARLLFIGMWNFADDEGRMVAAPARLKAEVFPYDDDITPATVGNLINELVALGLVWCYTVDDRQYLWVVNFAKHQRISHPTPSLLPKTPEDSGKLRKTPETVQQQPESPVLSVIPENSGKLRSAPPQSNIVQPSLVQPSHPPLPPAGGDDGDGGDDELTLLQLLDQIMPGRVNQNDRDWLSDVVQETSEEAVRYALTECHQRGAEITSKRKWIEKTSRNFKAGNNGSGPTHDREAVRLMLAQGYKPIAVEALGKTFFVPPAEFAYMDTNAGVEEFKDYAKRYPQRVIEGAL